MCTIPKKAVNSYISDKTINLSLFAVFSYAILISSYLDFSRLTVLTVLTSLVSFSYGIYKFNFKKIASYLYLISMNLFLAYNLAIFGRLSGIQLMYFSLIYLNFIIFKKKFLINFLFIFLSLLCITSVCLNDIFNFIHVEKVTLPDSALILNLFFSVSISTLCLYLLASNINKSEKNLECRAKKLEFLKNIPDLIIEIDKSGYICEFQLHDNNYFDNQEKLAVGANISSFLGEDIYLAILEKTKFLKPNQLQIFEYSTNSNNKISFFESRIMFSTASSFMILIRNITDRKLFENEIMLSKDTALKLADSRNQFIAMVSHEIRTPMNGIIGMTNLLLQTEQTREQRDFTEIIKTSSDSLLRILNNTLDYTKFEYGNLDLEEISFNLKNTIEEITEIFSLQLGDKQNEIIVVFDKNLPQFIKGDVTRLRQVIINLVGNAIKFTEKGKIIITVSVIQFINNEIEIKFSIKDDGIGIKKDNISKLFKPFTQADSAITREFGGTGLGLSVCKKIINAMNGRIWVESEYNNGSNFIFTIKSKYINNTVETNTLRFNNKKIIFIYDNELNYKVFKQQSEIYGFKYIAYYYKNIPENLSESYSILLLDINPLETDLDNLITQLYYKLSESINHKILITGFKIPFDRYEYFFDYCTYKPIKQAKIYERISSLLKGQKIKTDKLKISDTSISDLSNIIPSNILVVEDNLINQKVIQFILNKMGYKIDIANNGLEAVEMVKYKNYDIIFMDLNMPIMNGIEATKIIRESKKTPVIIAMTASNCDIDRELCLSAGMSNYINKPIKADDFRSLIISSGMENEKYKLT